MRVEAKRILLATWEGGGNLAPEMGVARRLVERGHRVCVLGDPTIRDDAETAGCAFRAWTRAPHRTSLTVEEDLLRDWEVGNPLAMLRRVRDVMLAGPAAAYAADTRDAIETDGSDVLLTDALVFGAMIAGEAAGIPVIPLVPNIWMFPVRGAPMIGPGFPLARTFLGRARDRVLVSLMNRIFAAGLPVLNAARAEHGLAPLRSFYDQVLARDRILVQTSPTFDFSSPFVPPNARYVGPVLDDPPWAGDWTPPWPASNRDPLVLVGFSSTFQDQASLLRRVVEALSSLPVRGLVTLGEMLEDGAVVGTDRVTVVRSAPHGRVLPETSVVVTHCGHGTTMKSLAAGVPMVCIPMGRDQNDTAARVVHHGAGVRLPTDASVARIGAAVERVLGDPAYRAAAGRLAAAIASEAGATDPVAEIEAVLLAREALRSGEGGRVASKSGVA